MPKPTKRIVKRKFVTPKECPFCKEEKEPVYSDVDMIRRYISERGKILGRDRTGICSKHQRRLTIAVKQARILAFLPFVVR